jgi:regulator of sirC expression with transglutaminase-like and TPR domain
LIFATGFFATFCHCMENVTLNVNEMKALVSLLGDTDPEVQTHVEQKIISLGDSIIPVLEKEWEQSFDPDSQKRIEEIIHTLQFDNLKRRLFQWKQSGAEDLLEGLWLIATYQYPDLEFTKIKDQVQQIYYETWLEFKPDTVPLDQIKIINSVMFNKLKFSPNTKNFHSVGNSMINIVLETRKGNPISLCCLYMLVAQRMKLPIYGVNLPNLFILTYKQGRHQFYINVFNKGLVFSKQDIDNYLQNLNLKQNDIFYQPCSHLDIVRRVMRNMIVAFEKTGEDEREQEIRALLEVLTDEDDPYGSL